MGTEYVFKSLVSCESMRFGSLFAASGAVPSSILGLLLSLLYLLASLYVYISLTCQISARTRDTLDSEGTTTRRFGLPEAILAALLIGFLFLTIGASVSQPSIQFSARNLLANFLLTGCVVLVIITFLQFRGFDVGSLGGFFTLSFVRTLSTGAILLFFAYPLILVSDAITQRLFGGGLEPTKHRRVFQRIAHDSAANDDYRFRHRNCAGG